MKGDKIAFSHLFSFYRSQVFYYCVHFVKDKEVAEDITQDIFLTIWEKILNFGKCGDCTV